MKRDQARVALERSKQAQVNNWLVQAQQAVGGGRLPQARLLCEEILRAVPDHVPALALLAMVRFQQGSADAALEGMLGAVQRLPEQPVLWATLGNIQAALGKSESAVSSFEHALAIKPDFAEVWNNLGNVLMASGQLGKAESAYRRSIDCQPNFAQAHNNLGAVLRSQGNDVAAAQVLREAVRLAPNYGQAHCSLAAVLQEREPDPAERHARRAVELMPTSYEAWATLGKILQPQSKSDESRAAYARAIALRPSPGLAIVSALLLPTIMGTKDEVRHAREVFEANLESLCEAPPVLSDPVKDLCNTNFLLAYHGVNDRPVQQKIASFYLKACPALGYVAPHCRDGSSRAGERKRVGFVSRFIAKHSVALCYSKIIEFLARDPGLEVYLISNYDETTVNVQDTYPDFAGQYVRMPMDLMAARKQIATLELDVLAYLDIGMDPFTYFLAFSRLAPIQCVFDGHPVTTGIPAMDYYLSLDGSEPADAQSHYSERLQRLSFGAYYFERKEVPADLKDRAMLGMPADGTLYVCPMVLFKIHPDFDAAIGGILEADPRAHVVFFEDARYSNWKRELGKRFDQTIDPALRERIVFMPWVADSADFLRVIAHSDVILDPFHFGLGSTAIAVCSVGTPFVTLPSDFARGRYAMHCARVLGVDTCIAHDVEDYVQIAVRIANDKSLRTSLKESLVANQGALLGNQAGIEDVAHFFKVA